MLRKRLSMLFVFAAAALLFSMTAFAQQVRSNEELEAALNDSSVKSIEIAYSRPYIGSSVPLDRDVAIDGGGETLTFYNEAALHVKKDKTLKMSNITLCGMNNFAVRTQGTVSLSGTVNFADGFGVLLESGGTVSGTGASITASSTNKIVFAADCGSGTAQIKDVCVNTQGADCTVLYYYNGTGTVIFSGTNAFECAYGRGIYAQGGSNKNIKLASGASLSINAVNARSGNDYCAAIETGDCAWTMEKSSVLRVNGPKSALMCRSINTGEDCTVDLTVQRDGGKNNGKFVAGALFINGGGCSFGAGNKTAVNGTNGIVSYGGDVSFGAGSTLDSQIMIGDGICAYNGGVSFADNCIVKIKASEREIYSKKDFSCANSCDVNLSSSVERSQGGVYTDGNFTIGDYSVLRVRDITTGRCAVSTQGALKMGNYATLETDCAATGAYTQNGMETGQGCVVTVTAAEAYGIYSNGELLADKINFGKNSTVNVDARNTALYSKEGIVFEDGCKAALAGGNETPVVFVDTKLDEQGYMRITGSTVDVRSKQTTDQSSESAVRVVGSTIVENGSVLNAIGTSSFAVRCMAGDLIVGVGSSVYAKGGCGVFVDDGNVRLTQGGALYAEGTLDSGVRVKNGMLRVANDCTIISQGERFGAEMLSNSSIWLESPKYFDLRSTKTTALYVEDGVFSASAIGTLSAWYPKNGTDNISTWWNENTDGMLAWEINSKLAGDKLGYADFTQHDVNGTVSFAGGEETEVKGFASNVSEFSAKQADRISSYKTRPIGVSNYMFIPAGRSFSWQLSCRSVEGENEKFELVDSAGSGSVAVSPDGQLTYYAPDDVRGEQTFDFTVTGEDGAVSLPAKVTINVTRSKSPAAYSESFFAVPNGSLTDYVTATDFDGFIAQAEITKQPEHGSVSIGSDGAFRYTPEDGYVGVDSFMYTVSDNDDDKSTPAIVTLLVGMDKQLCALNKTYIAAKNEPTKGKISYQPAKNTKTAGVKVQITSQPTYGTVDVTNTDFVYTPPVDFAGTETIGFTVTDSEGNVSNEGYIMITTVPSQKPVAQSMKIDCTSGKKYTGKLSADDLDGIVTLYEVDILPEHGKLEMTGTNSTFSYKPESEFVGTDSFTFFVTDNEGLKSESVTVTINVDTLASRMQSSGEMKQVIIFASLGAVVLLVAIILIATGVHKKRKKQEVEYYQQFQQNDYDDYNRYY